jgi:hypothetical protein
MDVREGALGQVIGPVQEAASGPALGRDSHSAASYMNHPWYVKRSSRDQSIPHLLLGLAEVDVEILELGGPATPDGPFDARARGPAGLHFLEGPGDRRARRSDRGGVLDLTVGDTGRSVEQHVARPGASGRCRTR